MSGNNRKKRSTLRPSNPFDSDYNSASDVSRSEASTRQSGKGGVSFDLDTIAASRRAMISGKAPSAAAKKAATRTTTRPNRSSQRSSDLETGEARITRKVRTQGTSDESADSGGFKHPIVVEDHRKSYRDEDEDSESGSSSGSENGSDSDDDSSYDSIDDMKKRRKPYIYAAIGVVSLMLLGGIIALSVVIFGEKNGDKSAMPILTARQESLHNIIKTVVPSDVLTNAETPQYRAHQWLLYEDSLGLAPASGASRDRVIQRYALAAFFFSTGGPRSWKSHNWLDGDECAEEWDGLGCTDDGLVHVISLSKLLQRIYHCAIGV